MTPSVSIRAFGAQNAFKQVSLERINRYVRSARTFYNLNRSVAVALSTLQILKSPRFAIIDGSAFELTVSVLCSPRDWQVTSYTDVN